MIFFNGYIILVMGDINELFGN